MDFTLSDFAAVVRQKYAPLRITFPTGEAIEFAQFLQLPDGDRREIIELQKTMDRGGDDGADRDATEQAETLSETLATVRQILLIACGRREVAFERLLSELPGDGALMELLSAWNGSTELGEASPSLS